jgi:hypothetical protein
MSGTAAYRRVLVPAYGNAEAYAARWYQEPSPRNPARRPDAARWIDHRVAGGIGRLVPSAVHSQTFPCISKKPHGLAAYCPTSRVCLNHSTVATIPIIIRIRTGNAHHPTNMPWWFPHDRHIPIAIRWEHITPASRQITACCSFRRVRNTWHHPRIHFPRDDPGCRASY